MTSRALRLVVLAFAVSGMACGGDEALLEQELRPGAVQAEALLGRWTLDLGVTTLSDGIEARSWGSLELEGGGSYSVTFMDGCVVEGMRGEWRVAGDGIRLSGVSEGWHGWPDRGFRALRPTSLSAGLVDGRLRVTGAGAAGEAIDQRWERAVTP